MSKAAQVASFEDFLNAPSRLEGRTATGTKIAGIKDAPTAQGASSPSHSSKQPKTSPQKVKVGLTIDPDIVDAIDDYIYHERKQGRRLKKNDVYEVALRQFLGLEGGDDR